MPLTKLTLSVDDEVVEGARDYSQRHNTSISRLVSNFLAGLSRAGDDAASHHPPVVRRLMGVLPATVSEDDYYRHLDDKYRL